MSPEAGAFLPPGGSRPRPSELSSGVPEYASTKLIAYLGNKRAMLPSLAALFSSLESRAPAASPLSSFLDPFAGSGSVARLARSRGLRVMAGDAEEYAYWVNLAWLGVSAEEGPGLFRGEGGLAAVLEGLNRLHPEREDEDFPASPYIARHYAPSATEGADYRRERLFYTRENAVFLDRARAAIEALRPLTGPPRASGEVSREELERALLLGPLIYEAATHANTSGLFKACHKGFGGHGRDALGRILAPMRLEAPLLWPGPPAEVCRAEARDFCASRPADLCYLDPPYNQHQYGSNYHLLNTVARPEPREVSEERRADGSLVAKAGIPADWKASRSAFCSRPAAGEAFRSLLSAIDARFIVLSYNDEGLVPREELFELLSDRAEVELRAETYVRYRGGRQSAGRRIRNHELLFVAERREGRPSPALRAAAREAALGRLEAGLRLASALASAPAPSRIEGSCPELGPASAGTAASVGVPATSAEGAASVGVPATSVEGAARPGEAGLFRRSGLLVYRGPGGEFELGPYEKLRLEAPEGIEGLESAEKARLATLLEPLLARDNAESCYEALRLLERSLAGGGRGGAALQRLALSWLRKLAHPRYRAEFGALYARASRLAAAEPEALRLLGEGLERLSSQAFLRMGWEPATQGPFTEPELKATLQAKGT